MTTAFLNEFGRELAQQGDMRFELRSEVLQSFRTAFAYQHFKAECAGKVGAIQRHAGKPGNQQPRSGGDVQLDLLLVAHDLGCAGKAGGFQCATGIGQGQVLDQGMMAG
ncbi:hypothetical protein D3C80_1263010 [compost metagenome]